MKAAEIKKSIETTTTTPDFRFQIVTDDSIPLELQLKSTELECKTFAAFIWKLKEDNPNMSMVQILNQAMGMMIDSTSQE